MNYNEFTSRHIGPRQHEIDEMLKVIKVNNMNDLIRKVIPSDIIVNEPLNLKKGISEHQFLNRIKRIASKNKLFKTYIGLGYYNTIMPAVIKRNILENPAWYTPYTPYQAEISQGRLEALLNFQTMVTELTKMDITNASLLDEASAAAEAMFMMYQLRSRDQQKKGINAFFVDKKVFPQTIDVLKTRAEALNIDLIIDNAEQCEFGHGLFGALIQYPDSFGNINHYSKFIDIMHQHNALVAVSSDLLSLALLTPPGEWGADIVLGSAQRFGTPLAYGGPHAAYFATKEKYKRKIPGRIIGVSVDKQGDPALRMAIQTREQHIKREKATSNICTAQALLATISGMYGVYHGAEGLKAIAMHIHQLTVALSDKLIGLGFKQLNENYFDTLKVQIPKDISPIQIKDIALDRGVNFRYIDHQTIGISLDETSTLDDINRINQIFSIAAKEKYKSIELPAKQNIDDRFIRKSGFMQQDVFNHYRSETEMMRYIKRLEQKDFSLVHSMIPLGSCTMKLNAAAEMMPLSWDNLCNIHPFVPLDQSEGYQEIMSDLGKDLLKITGMAAISFQPNSGAMGEYAGLMVMRQYHTHHSHPDRNIVLIPSSAHGTNPASAIMAGMEVKIVPCDEKGNVDIHNLKQLAEENKDRLAGFMVTYPSTHGIFEKNIIDMVNTIHENGGLVYMDGANLNAQNGLTNLAKIGADVCHLNLHKTFAIPHGGGGPGMGPVVVAENLVEFLPTHPLMQTGGKNGIHAVTGSPWGSPGILPISYGYIKMLGKDGIRKTAETAILNANYISKKLSNYFDILYTNDEGMVGHEMIVDCRPFRETTGITETDIAKRLMDYGFHAPTLSFPVPGTLMIEPTESESLQELERFIEAMGSIHDEIKEIEQQQADKKDNVLKNAPHTIEEVTSSNWSHSYSREKAAYPLKWLKEKKFWPSVARVDDAYGDRHLVCTCEPIDEYRKSLYD
jgi:glycine dehydrogenase